MQVAEEGLSAMEAWMKEIGLIMNISELGATKDMSASRTEIKSTIIGCF